MDAWDFVVHEAATTEQRRRSFTPAARYEGQLPGLNVSDLVNPTVEWSASRLETYRACAFRFFSHYGLHLSELNEEQVEADAATRGTVMHEMLEDALSPLAAAQRPLDEAGLAEAIERLSTSGRQLWESAPARHAFGRAALWRFEATTAIALLESLLTREAAHGARLGNIAVVGGERRFVRPLPGIDPPMLVQARIDRVDATGDTIQVVDYKTGRLIIRKDIEEGRRLQLQLYALVAGAELGARRLVARYAFLRPGKKEWDIDNARAIDAGFLDNAAQIASSVRTSVTGGAFEVAPTVECPTYCEARTLCRVNHFSRSKTWS
jgi:RecB family exonuclease